MTAIAIRVDSIAAFEPAAWDRCFPGEGEGWDYYRACEDSAIPDFDWEYFAVVEDGRLLAAVPAFRTRYRLDTTVQGALKTIADRLARLAPRLMNLELLCLGSPVTESCRIGFAPEIPDRRREELLRMLIWAFEESAARQGVGLLGVKDARDEDEWLWRRCVSGYGRMAGQPGAELDLSGFADLDEYLGSLSRATRKDMRRKLRAEHAIRIEYRREIDDVLGQVGALYEATAARSALRFECLPPAYFANVLRQMRGRAWCVLYWLDAELVAFNLLLDGPGRVIDKFIGMRYDVARKYNLYFLSWMANVRHCIARRIPVYQSGQGLYAPKVRLGSRLLPQWQYFRHRNPLVNAVLRLVCRFVRLDRSDPAIRALLRSIK
jgi:hypothetical protein